MHFRSATALPGSATGGQILAHCSGLPGEKGLVRLQVDFFQQSGIRGHPVAGVQHQQVSRHHFPGGDGPLLAFPDHGGHRRRQLLQGRGGLFRPVFLDKTQHHAGQHDGQNDPGIQAFPQDKGDRRGRQQNGDQEVGKLAQQDAPGRNFFTRGQFVGAVALQALLGGGGAQTPGSGVQGLKDLLRRECMEMQGFR